MDEMTKRNIIMDNYQNPYKKEEHKEYDYKEEAIKLIDNFINMVYEKEYDEELLNELIVYDKIYLQPNRITCVLLPFKNIKEYLMEK